MSESRGGLRALAAKLPSIPFGPRPKPWDFAALMMPVAGVGIAAASWAAAGAAEPGMPLAGPSLGLIVLAQLAISTLSLLLLGKTAKEGTLWGNLAAVAGALVGVSGVLLAAALWAAA